MSKFFAIGVYSITALFFFFFFLWPVGQTLDGAFFDADRKFTFLYAAEVFKNPIYLEGLLNSFYLAIISTLFCLLIAIPLAFLSDRYNFPGKKWLSALVLVPMILPPFVGAIGVRQILGQYGSLNALLVQIGFLKSGTTIDWLGQGQFWGIIILNALHLYPILYLNIVASLANVDPAMEEAAQNLGCVGIRRFLKITLPLIMPGLFAGGTIVFIWAFTELGVPLMFDYTRVTSVQIFYGIKEIGASPFPYALVAVMLSVTVLLYAISKYLFGRQHYEMMPKATSAGGAKQIGKIGQWSCCGIFSLITLLAIIPHIGVLLVSVSGDWYQTIFPMQWTMEHYHAALSHDLTILSIWNSLKYSGFSTVLDIVLGIAIAYVVVRTTLPGRQLLDAMAVLPLAVPGLVLAFGYLAMTQEGRLFSVLNPAKDPTILLVIAYAVRRLPYVVRSAVAGFQQTSVTLEEAAQNLGCSPLRSIRKITLPLISANLIAGGLLAFSFAMLEVSDSLILARKAQDFPITKVIYELFQLLGEGRFVASALGVWAMVFLATTIVGTSLILGKKLGSLFRV